MTARQGIRTIGVNLLAWALVLVVSFPLIWMVVTSLRPQSELIRIPPSLIPRSITFEHYARMLWETPFLRYFVNSMILAVSTTVLVVLIGTLGAYSLVRFTYRGRETLATLVLFT
jgi:multiple sugar transport system permease protein